MVDELYLFTRKLASKHSDTNYMDLLYINIEYKIPYISGQGGINYTAS